MSRFDYIELFAGIGGFRSALEALGGRCVFASEIDKFATRAYKALYDGAEELHGDITQINARDVPDHDVLVGGFPCQAFSVAGQRKGFEDTRGTLFFEIARIAKEKRPRMMLLENVKGLFSHDKGRTIEIMAQALNDIGYAIDFTVLNSKYFGVPQNRERIFIVAHRDTVHEPWNIDGNNVVSKAKRRIQALGIRTFNFDWPTKDAVTTRLRDVLEQVVDERYYLSEEKTAKLIEQLEVRGRELYDASIDMKSEKSTTRGGMFKNGYIGALDHNCNVAVTIPLGDSDDCEMVGHVEGINGHDICRRVYSSTGVAPTIPTGSSGNTTPKIAVERVGNVNPSGNGMNGTVYADNGLSPTLTTNKGEGTKILTEFTVIQKTHSTCTTVKHDETGTLQAARLDKVPHGNDQMNREVVVAEVRPVLTPDREEKRQNGRRFKDDGEESFTLTAQDKHGVAIGKYPRYRIRKLTPRECWRLQAFTDEQFDKARGAGISDSQLYKQAGNAVTVSVISAIGRRLVPLLNEESAQ